MVDKPRVRIAAGSSVMAVTPTANTGMPAVFRATGGGSSFEAAGQGRRLRGFNPSRNHVNAALQRTGSTLVARARWLYENDGYAGNAVDEFTSAAIGDGIKPRPKIKNKAQRRALVDLFWRWTEEADADGMTDFYGLQEKIAREAYLAGEGFVRFRARRPGDMMTVPFQLQFLPSEMLDPTYNEALTGGSYIRAGIEFDVIGRRAAYHFWRYHPNDDRPGGATTGLRERVRVPAADVMHIYDGRQGGQIRGVPRVARVLVKLFVLESYDDAELERKRTAALFTGFLIGRGDNPLGEVNVEDDGSGLAPEPIAPMQPGAIVDLGDDKDIKFSSPAEVGGSYEAFQYRVLTKIAAGLGVPYAYMTGDVTRGNFSNVRTDIIRFRRRVSQWQHNTMIFQACRPVWKRFVDLAVMGGFVDLPNYDVNPMPYWAVDWLPPRLEWIDPAKDVKAEREAVRAGFKTRTQVIAERGYDREDIDDEFADERGQSVDELVFDSDASIDAAAEAPAPGEGGPDDENDDDVAPAKAREEPADVD